MSTYTVRKVMRPKKNNPLILHEGVQVLLANGKLASFRHWNEAGEITEINEPVIDFNADTLVRVQTLDGFTERKTLIHEPTQVVAEQWFDEQFRSVLSDIRPYQLFERDCSTNADMLLYGKPKYQQLKVATGIFCFVLLLVAIVKK